MEDSQTTSTDQKNVGVEENDAMEARCQTKNKEEVMNGHKSSTESVSNPHENELIDIDEIELSDEDTWLYKSPKKLTTEEKGLSPYKWLRKDVEDLENLELQMAKTALVSKLDELDILISVQSTEDFNDKKTKLMPETVFDANCDKSFTHVIPIEENSTTSKSQLHIGDTINLHHDTDSMDSCTPVQEWAVPSETKLQLTENQPMNDATDVLKIARLQEECLKQSSSKFLNESARTFPRSYRYVPPDCVRNQKLLKPASVEALHVCNGKQSSQMLMYPGVRGLATSSPNQSPFGSTASLNYTYDAHRSSLPNLNKGYSTLRPKRTKRPSEARVQCPLPIYAAYPKSQMNGTTKETVRLPLAKGIIKSPLNDYRESQTLPSSYRIKSRRVPSYNKEVSSTSCRRESAPPPPCQKDNLPLDTLRRDSAPCIAKYKEGSQYQQQSNTSQRITSPLSPRKNAGMLNQIQRYGGSTPILQNTSRTSSLNHLSTELRGLPNNEHSQQSAHSPSRRQPLSSVHNWSPKQDDNPVMHHNGDLGKSSIPSRIPSPASRSGIPVPSSQYITRTSPVDETWSQDFY